MIAGLTAAVCVCVYVCVCVCLCCACPDLVHIHAQASTRARPGLETACLLCITNHTQVWRAMKRLSTFNMQLEFFFSFSFLFFSFPRPHAPPPPPTSLPTIRLFVWLKAMWNVRAHLSLSGCYEVSDWTRVLQGVHEKVSHGSSWNISAVLSHLFQPYRNGQCAL